MKKQFYLLCSLLIVCFQTFGQDKELELKKDEVSGDSYYEEVVQLPGISQADLFKRSKTWIIANMKSVDNNIIFDDKEYSIVNSSAVKVDKKKYTTYWIDDGLIEFKFHVWLKDGRYKFRIDNIVYHLVINRGAMGISPRTSGYNELEDNKGDRYLKEQASDKLLALIEVYKVGMQSDPKQDKKDW